MVLRDSRLARASSSLARHNRAKEHLTRSDLIAAARELANKMTGMNPATGKPWDHVTEVRQAQDVLLRQIETVKASLSNPNLTVAERIQLQQALSTASKMLDYTTQFVP
jgi:hypothetical protein